MEDKVKDVPQVASRRFLYLAVCTGNLVAFGAGTNLGWSSPVNPKLTNANATLTDNPFGETISENQASWVGSLLAMGAIFGPFLAGFCADKFGRKNTLLVISGIPLVVAYLVLAFAKTVWLYYFARFLAGFALGGVFTVLPNFISEIAEDSNRGAMASSMNVFIVSGPLFSYLVGPYTSIMVFCIVCAIWPALFLVLFFFFVPESPYYLVAAGENDKALAALKRFRSTTDAGVQKELQNITNTVEEDMKNKGSFLDIFKTKALIKALVISLALVTFQQFSGINTILFYSENIFKATGTSIPPEISTMIVGGVQVGASFVTPMLIDRLGRKMLLIISGIGMMIAEIPLGVFFYLKDTAGKDVDAIFWLPILCLIFYIIAYNFGFGPLPWTVMAEIFPSNIKGPACTATASFCWFLGFIITRFFEPVTKAITMGGSFWMFSGFCLLGTIFSFTYMIETKGKSFQEIQETLAK